MTKRKNNSISTGLKTKPILFPNAAGIDLGDFSHVVALPSHIKIDNVKKFSSSPPDLQLMAKFLLDHKIDSVALEATGVYWISVFNELEAAGLAVYLINSGELRRGPGRNIEVIDAKWIQKNFALGLLTPSFIPPQEMVVLRGYARHRAELIQESYKAKNFMNKALRAMNIQLDKAVSIVAGQTGTRIVKAIIDGERDALALSELLVHRGSPKANQIVPYLQGVYNELHLFELEDAYNEFLFCNERILNVSMMISNNLKELGSDPTRNPKSV